MSKLAQAIFGNIAKGKMDRSVGAELLKLIKAEASSSGTGDMAIIGMSGRMPGANDLEQFWSNLRSGTDSIGDFPDNRIADVEPFKQFTYMKDEETSYSKAGYLDGIDHFDYHFFGISPKEASLMDPNQRIFLEVAWHALEDAGYGGKKLTGSRTGLYIGYSGWPMYGQFVSYVDPAAFEMSVAGNISAIIASRIPHLLDLKGPSMLIDTACSSSLVALHQACKAIQNGECEQALVGGIRLNLLPLDGFVKYGIESSDSRAKAFDDRADGTSLSEGIAALFIKPLERALRDGDDVYAVIKGSAINQDGNSINITAPNAIAQEDVIIRAWKDADVDPATISYIEAHGTGTKLGDPIEIDGIQKAFRRYTDKKQFCSIGSVKSNIGHIDAAAGLAGVIKCILAMKHKEIPPTLHFEFPNRKISFEQSPVYVNDRLTHWEAGSQPRRCGVSSFGFSGTNCHVVLEEAPAGAIDSIIDSNAKNGSGAYRLFTLTAKSEHALAELVDSYEQRLSSDSNIDLADLCYTASTGRGHYSYRLAVLVSTSEELLAALRQWKANPAPTSHIHYGFHKVISGKKTERAETEFLDSEIRTFSSQADLIVQRITETEDVRLDEESWHELGKWYVLGAEVNWEALYRGEGRRKVRLPVYPFEKSRCWMRLPEAGESTGIKTSSIEQGKTNVPAALVIAPASKRQHYPVSAEQNRLYQEYSGTQDIGAQHITVALQLQGDIDPTELERAASELVRLHEPLRTSFYEVDGELVQEIHSNAEVQLERLESLETHALQSMLRPYDIQRTPLFRVGYVKATGNTSTVALDLHALIADEHSAGLLVEQLGELYAGVAVSAPGLQYKDFCAWQQEQLLAKPVESSSYYSRILTEALPKLELANVSHDLNPSLALSRLAFTAEADLAGRLQRLAAQADATVENVLLAAYMLLLSKYSGQTDIGVIIKGNWRKHPVLATMIGQLSSMRLIRNSSNEYKTFEYFLSEVAEHAREADAYAHLPVELLNGAVQEKQADNRNAPFFEAAFGMTEHAWNQNEVLAVRKGTDLEFEPVLKPLAELDLSAREEAGILHFELAYVQGRFRDDFISRFELDYKHLLEHVTNDMTILFRDITLSAADIDLEPVEEMDAFEFEINF